VAIGYRHWHADLRSDDTPLEAGLAFTCKLKSPVDFQGRDVIERQKSSGFRKRIACFTIDEYDNSQLMAITIRCKYEHKCVMYTGFERELLAVNRVLEMRQQK